MRYLRVFLDGMSRTFGLAPVPQPVSPLRLAVERSLQTVYERIAVHIPPVGGEDNGEDRQL